MAALACGCAMEIVDDVMHVFPCSPEHQETMSRAAELVAIANDIPFEMEDAS